MILQSKFYNEFFNKNVLIIYQDKDISNIVGTLLDLDEVFVKLLTKEKEIIYIRFALVISISLL